MFRFIRNFFRRENDVFSMPADIGALDHLPPELKYLIRPAFKFGRHQFDSSMFNFLDRASRSDMQELSEIADRVKTNNHYDDVNEFLDRYSMTDHEECANLYFLFGVMDHADLEFEQMPE